jgi:EmrB/QacA subfamily drug resistance transporter
VAIVAVRLCFEHFVTTRRPLTVVSLLGCTFMAALELTVVSTAMPTVVGELGGIQHYAWVFSAYLLTSTVMVPIYGKLADLYGRKPLLLYGIAAFLAGSMASGLSQSMTQLIAFRALQGLGAGAMQPISLTIIGDIYPARERARMQGLFGAMWGVAALVGPLAGGLIVKYLSWRWVFFLNVPFGVVAAALLVIALHEQVARQRHALDFAGAATLTVAVTGVLAVAQGSISPVVVLPVAGIALGAFFWIEGRAAEPIVPLQLFRTRIIGVASLASTLLGAAMLAMVTFVPLFVQAILGGSPTEAGLAITPMVIGWPIASALGGRLLPYLGFRPLIRGGLLISAAGAAAMAFGLTPGAALWVPRAASTLFGAGLGFANTSLLIAVQTSVKWEQRGIATASTMFCRTVGGALSIGALGGILAAALRRDPTLPREAASQLLGPEHGRHLSPELLHRLSGVLEQGLARSFWVILGLAVAAFCVGWLFPPLKLADAPAAPMAKPVEQPSPDAAA